MQTRERLILHDLPESDVERLFSANREECVLFPAYPSVRSCIGCFGCWVKTPGRCVINDRGNALLSLMSRHRDFMVISRLLFGGFSPDVKACLDRGIGHLLPFFRIVDGETHHSKRYETLLSLHHIFYGPDITEREEGTARRLTAANARNFGAETYTTRFYPFYVDGIPSHLLRILDGLQGQTIAPEAMVYAVVNNGFYEARQNALAVDMIKSFCERAGLRWGQALGVGGGGMLHAVGIGRGLTKGCGHFFTSSIGLALDLLAKNILELKTAEDRWVHPNIPRFLYIFAAHLSWRRQARKNGLRAKQLYDRQ